ncbi:MAG: type II toxin-antitoxin system Phd/YefM family antitoxin [Bacteroidales bacterium]|nr:type II toxin-antitoxin system Phd/YefM family antitoxin [Bacteroidales bacterium]
MKTTTISILRQNIKSYIDGVIETNETVLVNKGSDGAVIISLAEYTRLVEQSQTSVPTRSENEKSPVSMTNSTKYIDIDIEDL